MLSSCAAALKLSCSATARNVRSWCSVRALSTASVSAITNSGSTIGQVTSHVTDPVGGGSATASDRELDRLRRRRAGVLDPTPGPGTGRRGRPHGARERLVALLDPDSFVELDAAAGAGVVVGFGT